MSYGYGKDRNHCYECSHEHVTSYPEICTKSYCACEKRPKSDKTREKISVEAYNKNELANRPPNCTCDSNSYSGEIPSFRMHYRLTHRTPSNHLSGCPERKRKVCKETLTLIWKNGLEVGFNCTNQSHKYRGTHSTALTNVHYGGGPRLSWSTWNTGKQREKGVTETRVHLDE